MWDQPAIPLHAVSSLVRGVLAIALGVRPELHHALLARRPRGGGRDGGIFAPHPPPESRIRRGGGGDRWGGGNSLVIGVSHKKLPY